MNEPRLTDDEQEFLHKMYEETFDFDKWADSMDIAIENGEIESRSMPMDDTIFVMEVMDIIRKQWGLVYPQEK